MKRLVAVVCLALIGTSLSAAEKARPAGKEKGGFVHVVLFRMKKGAPSGAIDSAIKDCHGMLARISSVRLVKAGRPSPKQAEKFVRTDYDMALLVLVDDFAGLKAYLDDPIHVAFVKKHIEHFDLEHLRVFDFINDPK